MRSKWVVVANSALARVYSVRGKSVDDVNFVIQLDHPASKKKTHDLVSDRPGQFNGMNPARGSFTGHNDPKEVEREKFAKEVANFLDKERVIGGYHNFVVIAEPHFYGILAKNFTPQTESMLEKFIPKDIAVTNEADLKEIILRNLLML